MEISKPAVSWFQWYWPDEDILYFFEADEDGWVLRQVELQGPDRTPITAASLAEWPEPTRENFAAIKAYDAKYGGLADQPLFPWEPDSPGVAIDRAAFDEVWVQARAHLERKALGRA
jgi:hypothetical protein